MKTIKTMDLTLEDFFLIGKPEYLSKYSHLDQNYGRGLGYMRDKLLPALALLTLFQALFFIAVISFSTDGEFVIAWYVINAASLGLFVTLLLTTLILTPERLAENYELAFWWGMISIFSIPLWITSLVSIFSARTADQFVLYWLLMGGSALLWYLIFYIRVTRQIKKGEYRKDGGGFWGKKLRHFFLGGGGEHLVPFAAIVCVLGTTAVIGIVQGGRKMVELFFPEMIESSHIIALVVIINILIFSVLGYVVGIHNLAYRKLGIKNPHYTKP